MAQDLRTYLADNEDLVLRITKPVAPEFLSTLIVQADRPVLFDRIEGHPDWRLCDLLFRDRLAQSRVLGTTPENVLSELADRLARPPVAPKVVNTGPVKDRIRKGDQVDLAELPGFQHGARDPGPSIIAMNICQGPDGGNVNFSFTRLASIGARRVIEKLTLPPSGPWQMFMTMMLGPGSRAPCWNAGSSARST